MPEVPHDPDLLLRSDRLIPLLWGTLAGAVVLFCIIFVHDVIDTSYYLWKNGPTYYQNTPWWDFFVESDDLLFASVPSLVCVIALPVFLSNFWRMGVVWEVCLPQKDTIKIVRRCWGKRSEVDYPATLVLVGYGNAMRMPYRVKSYGNTTDVVAVVGDMACLIDYNCAYKAAVEQVSRIASTLGVSVQENIRIRCRLPFFMFN